MNSILVFYGETIHYRYVLHLDHRIPNNILTGGFAPLSPIIEKKGIVPKADSLFILVNG